MWVVYYSAVLTDENPLGPETGLTHFRAEGSESAFDRLIDTRFFYPAMPGSRLMPTTR